MGESNTIVSVGTYNSIPLTHRYVVYLLIFSILAILGIEPSPTDYEYAYQLSAPIHGIPYVSAFTKLHMTLKLRRFCMYIVEAV